MQDFELLLKVYEYKRYDLPVLSVHAAFKRMVPVVFEKDDDDNAHIDFITAASVCG